MTYITTVLQLTDAEIAEQREVARQIIRELIPVAKVNSGPIDRLHITPAATLAAARLKEIDLFRRSTSLKLLTESTVGVDSALVDQTAANYRLYRTAGAVATGQITIAVTANETVVIPARAAFVGDGSTFETATAYVARTVAEGVQEDNDRLLILSTDGTYQFTIPVRAIEAGSAANIIKDTALLPQFSISNFQRAFAAQDFVDGVAAQTDESLVTQALLGFSAQTASNRMTIAAAVLAQAEFAEAKISTIGYGDSEMRRDTHALWPVPAGARTDLYVRTSANVLRQSITKSAVLVQKLPENQSRWRISLTRDDYPGFYDVVSIVVGGDSAAASFDVVSDSRSVDTSGEAGQLRPDIATTVEAVYSRYQTAVIEFIDSVTDTSSMTELSTTQLYDITLRGQASIDELQQFVGSRDFRYTAGDTLVRAAIPCFVSVAIELEAPAGTPAPNADEIKTDVVTAINSQSFNGRLYASMLIDTIQEKLPPGVRIARCTMRGVLLRPDGERVNLTDDYQLQIPREYSISVSPRTVAFYAENSDISLSAYTITAAN